MYGELLFLLSAVQMAAVIVGSNVKTSADLYQKKIVTLYMIPYNVPLYKFILLSFLGLP